MTFLLDVDVLIALIDPAHPDHDTADIWFASLDNPSWATCPLTENAILRIVGSSSYRNSPGSPAAVVDLLKKACSLPGHIFWPDSISLLTHPSVNSGRLQSSSQVTDIYLIALAQSNGGQLATFDRRIKTEIIKGSDSVVFLIPNQG